MASEFDLLEPAEQLRVNLKLYLKFCHHVLAVPYWNRPPDELKLWLWAKFRAGRDMLATARQVDNRSLRLS
jgi:hypothetical protein